MNNKINKILHHLSSQLDINHQDLQRIIDLGCKEIFREDLQSLLLKCERSNAPFDIIEDLIVGCAYGGALKQLLIKMN